MKKILVYLIIINLFSVAGVSNAGFNFGMVNAVKKKISELEEDKEYEYPDSVRQDMRDFVIGISEYSKDINQYFIIIPQNGHELLVENGEESGPPASTYLNAIDGVGREDLFYGYDDDDIVTPTSERNYMVSFMDIAKTNGVKVLVTDYCWTQSKMADSYTRNSAKGYISFSADERELNNIPSYPAVPNNVNSTTITLLSQAKNFLYIINTELYATKDAFLNTLRATNYDMILIDLFYDGSIQLTAAEINSLKVKANGAPRLVIAYMSIGEAEDYRYYWDSDWKPDSPSWLADENPDWEGNYKVRYWDKEWQNIIYGNDSSYLKKVIDAGFNGVYLDIIDAYEYFE